MRARRIVAVLICFCIFVSVISLADTIDFSSMTDDELLSLVDAAINELTQRNNSSSNNEEEHDENYFIGRFVDFFSYWSVHDVNEMLKLCAPSWEKNAKNAQKEIEVLTALITPESVIPEKVTGTLADNSRVVEAVVPVKYQDGIDNEMRMKIVMRKENDDWYIDPQFLISLSETELYYNTNGGEYYHINRNCKIINPKYLPLEGMFYFKDITKDPYDSLKPCAVCGAPPHS